MQLYLLKSSMLLFAFIMGSRGDQNLPTEGKVMKDMRRISCLMNLFTQSFYIFGSHFLVKRQLYQLKCARAKLKPFRMTLVDMS